MRTWKLALGVALLGGIGTAAWNFDTVHWWVACRVDAPRVYRVHVRWKCAHENAARAAYHDSLWSEALSSAGAVLPEAYLREFPDGPHAGEARVLGDDRTWALCVEQGRAHDYLNHYPTGRHADEARAAAHDRSWRAAQGSTDPDAWRAFLHAYPESPHAADARARLDDAVFEAGARPEIEGTEDLAAYLDEFPRGRHADEARANLESALWSRAVRLEDLDLYDHYLARFPEGPHAAQAREIALGTPIAELVTEGAATTQVDGRSIEWVTLSLKLTGGAPSSGPDREVVPDGVTVRIPAGTYFASHDPSVQNMIARQTVRVRIHGNDQATVSVPAACGNKYKKIPELGQGLTIAALPESPDLSRLIPALEQPGVPYPIAQAAIWIVTDDAGFSELNDLVQRPIGHISGGTPLISDESKARAFALCANAGVDLRTKRIWHDRHRFREFIAGDVDPAILRPQTACEVARWGTAEELDAVLAAQPRIEEGCLWGILERNDPDLVRTLAKHTPSLTELFFAALRRGKGALCSLFIELGADINARTSYYSSALALAAGNTDVDTLRCLLDHGAAIDGDGESQTPLEAAAAARKVEIVRELVARGARVDAGELSALIYAVKNSELEMTRILLDAGADPEYRPANSKDRSALAWAVDVRFAENLEVVELLLAHGADPNRVSLNRTPLQLAAAMGSADVVAALLAAGGDPEKRPAGTLSPLEIARAELADEVRRQGDSSSRARDLLATIAVLER